MSWAAEKLGLSPNAVTLCSCLAGIGAAYAIYQGQYIIAALLIQLHHLLDGVDGNLARAQQRCTSFGKWLDIACDQIFNFLLLLSLALASSLDSWLFYWMFATFYFDMLLVHFVILPFGRRHPLIRDRWKQWFMDRGLMPGFDIFTIYLVISILLLLGQVDAAVLSIAVMKTLDWLYRGYECARTALVLRHRETAG